VGKVTGDARRLRVFGQLIDNAIAARRMAGASWSNARAAARCAW
jgi:signal transduction histidine kinase